MLPAMRAAGALVMGDCATAVVVHKNAAASKLAAKILCAGKADARRLIRFLLRSNELMTVPWGASAGASTVVLCLEPLHHWSASEVVGVASGW